MSFTIPNQADAMVPAQAAVDKVDIDMLVSGFVGSGVMTAADCEVTAQVSPNMTVAVAAGTMTVYGTAGVTVSAGNVTITTADATYPRFDLILVDSSGVKTALAGTPAANPVFPAVTFTKVCIAVVYVAAGATSIVSGAIIDKRLFVGVGGNMQFTGTMIVSGNTIFYGYMQLASGQVQFPGTQSPSADPHTLDDYEEGTWSPVIMGSSVSGAHTYAVSEGHYTKIGRMVKVDYHVALSAVDGSMAGSYALLGGYPFAKGAYGTYDGMPMAYWVGIGTAFEMIMGHMQSGNPFHYFFGTTAATGTVSVVVSPPDIAPGSTFAGSGVYHV